jgi:hypothetical protein
MNKGSRKWNKVFLLGMFCMVFTFGMLKSFVFAEEISSSVFGTPKYAYRLSNGSPDWDTFYRRCNQYAGQYRYYEIYVAGDNGSNRVRQLSQFEEGGGSLRRFIYGNDGVMVTMMFYNEPKPMFSQARLFTNYAEALRYWKNIVQTMG